MKGPGILWMLQTAAGLSMAGPMFIVGIEFARAGRLVAGVGFFVLGLGALYFPTYLVDRIGGPRTWVRRRLGRNGGDDESETSETGETSGGDERSGADREQSGGFGPRSAIERLRGR